MNANAKPDDDAATVEMDIYLVRDYHMDPEVAEETGEDPEEILFAPPLDEWDDLPTRVLEILEMKHLYGEVDEEDYPPIGEKVLYGRVEFNPETEEFVEFSRVEADA